MLWGRSFEISVDRLSALRQDGVSIAVLDVREPWEVAICCLEDSILIPMGNLPDRLDELPNDCPLVVMCHHGVRSARVATWLRRQGFVEALNLTGGIDAWAAQIDKQMRRY